MLDSYCDCLKLMLFAVAVMGVLFTMQLMFGVRSTAFRAPYRPLLLSWLYICSLIDGKQNGNVLFQSGFSPGWLALFSPSLLISNSTPLLSAASAHHGAKTTLRCLCHRIPPPSRPEFLTSRLVKATRQASWFVQTRPRLGVFIPAVPMRCGTSSPQPVNQRCW